MENETSKQHFKNLLSIAYADGILDKSELEFLFKKSDKYYITAEDVDGVIENSMYVKPIEIKDSTDRAEKMFDLIQMMLIDGESTTNERRICMIFGVNLGYAPEKIDELIDSTSEMFDNGDPEKDIIKHLEIFG